MTDELKAQEHAPSAQLAELDALAAQAAAEDFQPEPEATQPAGAVAAVDDIPTGELCAGLLGVSFGIIAARKGEHWQLKDAEAQALGGALGDVIDKYWPDFKGGPELALVVCSVGVLGPRVMMDKKVSAEQARQQQAPDVDLSTGGQDGD